MKIFPLAAFLALALSGSVAAQDTTDPVAETPAAAAAIADDEAPAVAAPLSPAVVAVVGTPQADKGLVVFFRPKKFTGAAAGIKVHEGDTVHGKLANGTWLAIQLDPGVHEFVAKGEVKDTNPVEVEAGETYFISASIGMGLVAGRKNFVLTDADAFEAVMGTLKPAKPLKK